MVAMPSEWKWVRADRKQRVDAASGLIEELAVGSEAARAQAESQASRSEIEGLLAGIEHLDEAEVDRLLAQYLGGPR